MLGRNFDAEVAFVVFESNIVARLVLLDQVVFEYQRFFIVAGNECLEVFDAPH
jgi:hypothetical protein